MLRIGEVELRVQTDNHVDLDRGDRVVLDIDPRYVSVFPAVTAAAAPAKELVRWRRTATSRPTVDRIHRETSIVEGHRDCYEQIYRLNQREANPIRDRLVPRLRRGGVDVLFYAIGGDTIAHSNGTDRPLFATLQNIDALVLTHWIDPDVDAEHRRTEVSDLPQDPDGSVRFVLHLEGGPSARGRPVRAADSCIDSASVPRSSPGTSATSSATACSSAGPGVG